MKDSWSPPSPDVSSSWDVFRHQPAESAGTAFDVTDLAHQLSHELRTPLTSILGFARLIQDSDSDAAAFAACIEASGANLLYTVRKLLNTVWVLNEASDARNCWFRLDACLTASLAHAAAGRCLDDAAGQGASLRPSRRPDSSPDAVPFDVDVGSLGGKEVYGCPELVGAIVAAAVDRTRSRAGTPPPEAPPAEPPVSIRARHDDHGIHLIFTRRPHHERILPRASRPESLAAPSTPLDDLLLHWMSKHVGGTVTVVQGSAGAGDLVITFPAIVRMPRSAPRSYAA